MLRMYKSCKDRKVIRGIVAKLEERRRKRAYLAERLERVIENQEKAVLARRLSYVEERIKDLEEQYLAERRRMITAKRVFERIEIKDSKSFSNWFTKETRRILGCAFDEGGSPEKMTIM